MKKVAYVVGLAIAGLLLPLAAGCGDDDPPADPQESTPAASEQGAPGSARTIGLDDRPFRLYVPSSYDAARPVPLVIGLHGYTSYAEQLESYFQITAQAEQRGFLYAMPNGTTDRSGDRFWNATNACCDFNASNVDDSGYLSRLIETVQEAYAVDPDAVFLIGHSNGGYMSHRMACEHADQITAIASLAGVLWADPARCTPSRPVSVLQIHGTADETVHFAGGTFAAGRTYPGAEETAAQWRALNGCSDVASSGPVLDLDEAVAGAETTVAIYSEGCGDGSRVELWRMQGSRHVPTLTDAFTPAVIDFFYATMS